MGSNKPYVQIDPDVLERARQIDLLSYLRAYEPSNLAKAKGTTNVYCTAEHGSWPVWCDYDPKEWNDKLKHEYAEQAALCGKDVFLVNPYCADPGADDCTAGAGAHFCDGKIVSERPDGTEGVLITAIGRLSSKRAELREIKFSPRTFGL